MTLEHRAAQAARSLRASVSGVAPVGIPAIVGRQRRSLITSFVAAAAFMILFVGIASAMPSFFEPDQVATEGSVPVSIPADAPLVIESDDKESDHLVDLDKGDGDSTLAVRQKSSWSDSPEPYTVFYGRGEPGSVVSAVSAYAEGNATVGVDGGFELKLWFDPRPPAGLEFPIMVVVDGESYQFLFTSTFDPDNIDFTAHQTYGASDDADAYEKFFGTAPPGTEVVATSAYGSASAVADDHGRWHLKLWFEGPLPLDEPFDVTLTMGSETFTFSFVSVFEMPGLPLSISQVNSTSSSSSPYVQFVGTAPVGTKVATQSSYGSHSIVVGESGEFNLKMWFSKLPPAGVQFPITVKVDGEHHGTFYFTSFYAPSSGGSGEVAVEQYNTSSSDPSPWVKFLVEGPVGTKVQITSPYGSMSRTMESGSEYVKLFFSTTPPAGEKFQVTVKINGSVHGTYQFTSHFDPANVEVSVSQHNTSSSDSSPWVKFSVTGPVGTQVQITSPYGSTSRTMESTSEHVKLFFSPVPPAGEEFQVTVEINGSVHGTYPFTSHWDPDQIIVTPVVTENSDPWTKIEYYGPAGTSFQLTSAYGNSDQITLGSNGSGHLKLQFSSTPPAGEQITITVVVNGSTHSTYGFTYQP